MRKTTSWISLLIGHTLLLGNIAAVCWLALCYAAGIVSPLKLNYLALFSLTTPFALAINFLFLFLWLFSAKKWRALFSLIPLLLCWQMIPAIFGIHFLKKNNWSPTENSFKLMAWNVHAMGIFNHPNEKKHVAGILELIREENPDILCLPEFSTPGKAPASTHARTIMEQNGYNTYRFDMDNGFGAHIWIGSAVFSRYPLVDYEAFWLNPYISLLQCDFRLPNTEIIRICILHLQSFGLTDADKAVIEGVKQTKGRTLRSSRSFLWKFTEAYHERAKEAEMAMDIIRKSPYPVIICGDFNDLPYSYTYNVFDRDYTDAFTVMGKGMGRTYNQIIPTLRIDHIFYDPAAFRINALKIPYSPFSDHNPVIANFEFTGTARN